MKCECQSGAVPIDWDRSGGEVVRPLVWTYTRRTPEQIDARAAQCEEAVDFAVTAPVQAQAHVQITEQDEDSEGDEAGGEAGGEASPRDDEARLLAGLRKLSPALLVELQGIEAAMRADRRYYKKNKKERCASGRGVAGRRS